MASLASCVWYMCKGDTQSTESLASLSAAVVVSFHVFGNDHLKRDGERLEISAQCASIFY